MRNVLVLFFVIACLAHADVIASSGPNVSFINIGLHIGSGIGDAQQEIAVPFTPSAQYWFTDAQFAVWYMDGIDGVVGNVNQLTAYLTTNLTDAGSTIESFDFTGLPENPTIVTAQSLLHPVLEAGTTYYLVLSAEDLLHTWHQWLYSDEDLDGQFYVRNGYNFVWSGPFDASPAYEIDGVSTPEPGTIGLTTLVLAACMAAAGRGKRARTKRGH